MRSCFLICYRYRVRVFFSLLSVLLLLPSTGRASPNDGILAGNTFNVSTSHQSDDSSTDRKYSAYRDDVRAFTRNAKDSDTQIRRNAVFNLCQLHRELVADTRYPTNRTLKGLRISVDRVLKRYLRDVKNQKASEIRLAKKKRSRENGESTSDSERGGSGDDSGDIAKGIEERTIEERAVDGSSAESYYSMGQFSGGPSQLYFFAGGRMAPPWDHGDELVALIQTTIDPATWDSGGGNGTIHYYQPSRILVVNATMRAHDDMQALLNKLRESGR